MKKYNAIEIAEYIIKKYNEMEVEITNLSLQSIVSKSLNKYDND